MFFVFSSQVLELLEPFSAPIKDCWRPMGAVSARLTVLSCDLRIARPRIVLFSLSTTNTRSKVIRRNITGMISHVKQFASVTYIHSLSDVVFAKNLLRRCAWLIVWLAAFCGMTAQVVEQFSVSYLLMIKFEFKVVFKSV